MTPTPVFQVARGLYFGYPVCCCVAFDMMLSNNRHPTPQQFKAANNTGFIPCEHHTKLILSGKITLESLIHDRKAVIAFPDAMSSDRRGE